MFLHEPFEQDFFGPTLPSNREMLSYYRHLHQVYTARYARRKAVSRCYELWEKAGIATAPMSYAIAQMENLVNEFDEQLQITKEDKEATRQFHEKLDMLFFVGTEDALKACSNNARKLPVASVIMHKPHGVLDKMKKLKEELNCTMLANIVDDDFGLLRDECEISFEASDRKPKLKLEHHHIFDVVKVDLKLDKNECEISDQKPKFKLESHNIFNDLDVDLNLDKNKCEISFEASDQKPELKLERNNIFDVMDLNLDQDECEISFEASDNKSKLKVKPVNNFNDEHYAAYFFEEEWNTRHPNYDEESIPETKIAYLPAFSKLYCIYCCQTMTSYSEVRVWNNVAEFTCQECCSVNFACS